jgi:hypothetical protein
VSTAIAYAQAHLELRSLEVNFTVLAGMSRTAR